MASCANWLCRCLWSSGSLGSRYPTAKEQPPVYLDTARMGQDVVIVKNGQRICGTGSALCNAPIVQNKAYFEVKVQQTGTWAVGLATSKVDLNQPQLGQDGESWVVHSDGTLLHNGKVLHKLSDIPQEGDVIGVAYDHLELNFFLNGKSLRSPVTGLRGEVYPILGVDSGAILDAIFLDFYHQPPLGYDRIMLEQSLL